MHDAAVVAGHEIGRTVRSFRWTLSLLGAERDRVAGLECLPAIATKASREIGRSAAEQDRHFNATAASEVEESAGEDRLHSEDVSRSRVDRGARSDAPSRASRTSSSTAEPTSSAPRATKE